MTEAQADNSQNPQPEVKPPQEQAAAPEPKLPFGHDRRVTFRTKYAGMLLPFICKEWQRYYLHGIYVEPHPDGGVLLVATDGHTAGIAYDAEGSANGPWICKIGSHLKRAVHSAIRSGEAKVRGERLIHFIGDTGYVTSRFFTRGKEDPGKLGPHHLAAEFVPAIDGTYPDWAKTCLKSPLHLSTSNVLHAGPAFTPNFNGEFINRFVQAGMIANPGFRRRNVQAIRMWPTGVEGPAIVQISGVHDFWGVLMPMKSFGRDQPADMPPWLAHKLVKPEQATIPPAEEAAA